MARALLDDLERSKLGGKSPEGRERTSRCGQFIGSELSTAEGLEQSGKDHTHDWYNMTVMFQ